LKHVGPATLAALVSLAAIVAAATSYRQDVSTTPSSKAPTVTVLAGTSGTTTLGTSGTSASTSATVLAVPLTVLKVHKVAGNWDVKVSLGSATGFSSLESASVALSGTTQVTVTLGAVTQSSGSTVALTGADLTLTAVGLAAPTVSGVLNLNVILVPQGGTQPVMTYPYTLTLG
jgi:hypothetical protein